MTVISHPYGHNIVYPQALDAEEMVKVKADILFNGNSLLKELPPVFDDVVIVLQTKEGGWLAIHMVTCSICGANVGNSPEYTGRHIEWHQKHGD